MKYAVKHSHPNPSNNTRDHFDTKSEALTAMREMIGERGHNGVGCSDLIDIITGNVIATRDWDKSRISWLQLPVKTTDKSSWVRAAQRRNLKLGAWVVEKLNKASAETGPKHLEAYVMYIRNTSTAPLPVACFDMDWEPIGPKIRQDMLDAGLITISKDGIRLNRATKDNNTNL